MERTLHQAVDVCPVSFFSETNTHIHIQSIGLGRESERDPHRYIEVKEKDLEGCKKMTSSERMSEKERSWVTTRMERKEGREIKELMGKGS